MSSSVLNAGNFSDTQSAEELLQLFFRQFSTWSDSDRSRITEAWNYLCSSTTKLSRFCGKPYFQHPMRVAFILAESNLDADSIIAAFFHNALASTDCTATRDEIAKRFGTDVVKLIDGTTKITSLNIHSTQTLQEADSIRKMLFAMIDDIRIILIKLADRLDRMRNLSAISPEAQKAVAQEALDIWAPLANRLGMSSIKVELEDLSLKFTNPDVFQQLKQIVSLKKEERSEYLEKAQKEIYKAASRAKLNITVTSRAKHFYSIYQKMRKRNKEADELFDLLAIRIICEKVEDCYVLVGLVHNLWKPLEGRFKDYIAMPKANGYQSLHTTVICEGKPLEIQIRTQEMHSVAEHGVASHWLYKKGTSRDIVSSSNVTIINQLKELREQHLSDDDFFNEIKGELLGDSIFVFTPKGDVKELPAGSTAIDFAYLIHSSIGNKIVGAKADGRIIPLSSPLKNTQIIDIITSTSAHPTVNQLKMVRTSKARNKIRSWLIQNDPTYTAEKQALLARKSALLESTSLKSSDGKNSVQFYNDAKLTDAKKLADGKSEIPAELRQAVIDGKPLADGLTQSNSTSGTLEASVFEAEKAAREAAFESEPVKIRIDDTTNFMITLARCCKPVYGDDIVGYVSRGRGIIVHRSGCRNFSRIPNINERTIGVVWEKRLLSLTEKTKK